MNDKYREFSSDKTNQKDGQFHMVLAWLAALSASIVEYSGEREQ